VARVATCGVQAGMTVASDVGLFGKPDESRDYLPLLRWMVVLGLVVFALIVLSYFGLIQVMMETDRTRLSLLILAIFAITSLHCLYQTLVVSRELTATRRIREQIVGAAGALQMRGDKVVAGDGQELHPGVLSRHISNLFRKAELQGGRRLDQTLLLRSLADKLRGREKLGWFVAEGLLRLALLGTAVGFILMLVPIAGLTSFDVDTLRSALAGMSGGMAIALNVTVAGIATALVLKLEYYFLDEDIAELFHQITEITEVYVVSALERGPDGGR
jgi:hypothetical protein